MTYFTKKSLSKEQKNKIKALNKEIDTLLDLCYELKNSNIVPRNKLRKLGKEIKEKFLLIEKIKNGYI